MLRNNKKISNILCLLVLFLVPMLFANAVPDLNVTANAEEIDLYLCPVTDFVDHMNENFGYICKGDRCEDEWITVDLEEHYGLLLEGDAYFHRYECVGEDLADEDLRSFGYRYNKDKSYPANIGKADSLKKNETCTDEEKCEANYEKTNEEKKEEEDSNEVDDAEDVSNTEEEKEVSKSEEEIEEEESDDGDDLESDYVDNFEEEEEEEIEKPKKKKRKWNPRYRKSNWREAVKRNKRKKKNAKKNKKKQPKKTTDSASTDDDMDFDWEEMMKGMQGEDGEMDYMNMFKKMGDMFGGANGGNGDWMETMKNMMGEEGLEGLGDMFNDDADAAPEKKGKSSKGKKKKGKSGKKKPRSNKKASATPSHGHDEL